MSLLENSRRALMSDLLDRRCSRSEISAMFESAGFAAVECGTLTKRALVQRYFDQFDWSDRSSAEQLFPLLRSLLVELKRQSVEQGSSRSRARFARIVEEGLWLDGLDFNRTVFWAPERRGIEIGHAEETMEAKRGEEPSTPRPSEGRRRKQAPKVDTLEDLSRRLCDLLAVTVHQAEEARTLAMRAKYPREQLPEFCNARVFWSAVVDGALCGRASLGALAREAASMFEYNRELADLAEIIGHDDCRVRRTAREHTVPTRGETRESSEREHDLASVPAQAPGLHRSGGP